MSFLYRSDTYLIKNTGINRLSLVTATDCMNRVVHPMASKIEQVAASATQGGAAVATASFLTLGFWNENSAAIVAMAAVFSAVCSGIGSVVWVYFQIRKHYADRQS